MPELPGRPLQHLHILPGRKEGRRTVQRDHQEIGDLSRIRVRPQELLGLPLGNPAGEVLGKGVVTSENLSGHGRRLTGELHEKVEEEATTLEDSSTDVFPQILLDHPLDPHHGIVDLVNALEHDAAPDLDRPLVGCRPDFLLGREVSVQPPLGEAGSAKQVPDRRAVIALESEKLQGLRYDVLPCIGTDSTQWVLLVMKPTGRFLPRSEHRVKTFLRHGPAGGPVPKTRSDGYRTPIPDSPVHCTGQAGPSAFRHRGGEVLPDARVRPATLSHLPNELGVHPVHGAGPAVLPRGRREDKGGAAWAGRSSSRALGSWGRGRERNLPAAYRFAFRELGLVIGLKAAESLRGWVREHPGPFDLSLLPRLEALSRYAAVGRELEEFWVEGRNRDAAAWNEHRDINGVTLATALAPGEFLAA